MSTITRTESSTFTASRAKAVFPKVFTDIINLKVRGFLSESRAANWREVLEYGLVVNGLEKFEIMLTMPSGTKEAFRYNVTDDGSVLGNDSSGGINFYGYPDGTTLSIVITRRSSFLNDERFNEILRRHGWGDNGSYLEGTEVKERSFSKEGFGITRSRITQ